MSCNEPSDNCLLRFYLLATSNVNAYNLCVSVDTYGFKQLTMRELVAMVNTIIAKS